MESERQVPKERGEELATKLKMLFFETSAKENIIINEAFETLCRQLLDLKVGYRLKLYVTCCCNYYRNKKYLFLKELQNYFRER